MRSYLEFGLPAGSVTAGSNTIELVLTEGGWVAWDALGIYQLS